MNMPERSSRYQLPPPHRRKTPSFSSSLLDSILRSIDETNDGGGLSQQQQQLDDGQDLMLIYEAKLGSEHIPSTVRRAIMIDQWMDKGKHDSSSSGTTSSETETPSTYRSLPNSFTISRDDHHHTCSNNNKREGKFIKSRAMKIYGKVKQPISPGSRISAFIYSLFASKKKAKIEEESINKLQDATSCTMSKKQQYSISSKRSVRFYPENGAEYSTPVPKYEKNYTTATKINNFVVNAHEEEDDDEEDDLFELEIGCAYRQELPVFETTDLRKIRI